MDVVGKGLHVLVLSVHVLNHVLCTSLLRNPTGNKGKCGILVLHVLWGLYSGVCTVNGAKLSMLMQRNVAAKGGTLLDVPLGSTFG